mmetsp:Transcript_33911/g.96070  ORF Transcript_33911/g.96070 Transcript_33911/m.96070 type:complete len:220 (+) Transcript_33911:639-1298(+)
MYNLHLPYLHMYQGRQMCECVTPPLGDLMPHALLRSSHTACGKHSPLTWVGWTEVPPKRWKSCFQALSVDCVVRSSNTMAPPASRALIQNSLSWPLSVRSLMQPWGSDRVNSSLLLQQRNVGRDFCGIFMVALDSSTDRSYTFQAKSARVNSSVGFSSYATRTGTDCQPNPPVIVSTTSPRVSQVREVTSDASVSGIAGPDPRNQTACTQTIPRKLCNC